MRKTWWKNCIWVKRGYSRHQGGPGYIEWPVEWRRLGRFVDAREVGGDGDA